MAEVGSPGRGPEPASMAAETRMDVLKITLEGATTSFRHPLFMLGAQVSFDMPPPATIYGHICSAMGEWVDPAGLAFAYRFTYAAKLRDMEHIHVLAPARGKLPGTDWPKVLEGNINPFQREILFQPRLTLYLNRPAWTPMFRSPRYAVALGRSQDLCAYTDVRVTTLEKRAEAYVEHTLIPFEHPFKPSQGVVLQMPRWVDPERNRDPAFARYVMVMGRVMSDDERALIVGGEVQPFWVDPESPDVGGRHLGLIFQGFK